MVAFLIHLSHWDLPEGSFYIHDALLLTLTPEVVVAMIHKDLHVNGMASAWIDDKFLWMQEKYHSVVPIQRKTLVDPVFSISSSQ